MHNYLWLFHVLVMNLQLSCVVIYKAQKMQARLSTIKVTSFSVMGTMYSGLY